MNRYLKSIMGAIIGAATAGGWLAVDLILPEPIGDYLLFILMGLVNAVIGWQVARLIGKSRVNNENKGMEPSARELKSDSN